MANGEFTCDHCGGVFAKAWSDDERLREYEEVFSPQERQGETVTVCDICYRELMKRYRKGTKYGTAD